MTMFKALDGSRISSSEIVKIEERGIAKTALKTRDNETYIVHGSMEGIRSKIEAETAQIIPAHPGYSVVFTEPPGQRDGEWKTFNLPVVGWRIMQSTCDAGSILESVPVVAGIYTLPDFWALILLDGNVAPSDRDSPMRMEEWLESLKKSLDNDGYYQDDDENENDDQEIVQ